MNGTNWTSYGGTCGSGRGQFYDPSGIAVDSAGKIYVMDTGNSRVVRIDDMTGANWVSYGSVGSGVGQFSQLDLGGGRRQRSHLCRRIPEISGSCASTT